MTLAIVCEYYDELLKDILKDCEATQQEETKGGKKEEPIFYETREIDVYNKYKEIKKYEKDIDKADLKHKIILKKKLDELRKKEIELKKAIDDIDNDEEYKKMTDEYRKKLDTFHIDNSEIDLLEKYDGIKLIGKKPKRELL